MLLINKINQISPTFINRFDYIVLEDKKNEDLKITSRTLINKYQMEHDTKKLRYLDQNNQVPIS